MIGVRLKKARERLNWSQSELARRAGVPQPLISQLESAQRDCITTDNARRLARALGLGVDYLIGTWDYEEDPEPVARG